MRTSLGLALLQVLPRDGLSVAADVAIVVIGVAIIVVAIVTVALLLRLNRAIGELRIGVRQNLGPVSDRARSISDNVEYITQALRADTERLNASVKALSDRLHQASDHMEQRIEEFNALMEVVQDEAEGIFIDTASTMRGVKAGASAIAGGPGRRRVGRTGRPSDEEPIDDRDETQALAAEEA